MSRFHATRRRGRCQRSRRSLVTTSAAAAAPAPQLDVYAGDIPRVAARQARRARASTATSSTSRAAAGGVKDCVHVETILSGEQARAARRRGHRRSTPKEIDGQTVAAARDAAGRRRLRGVQASTRPRRLKEEFEQHRRAQPADHEARQHRQDVQRRGHRRAQDQLGRALHARRLQAVGALHRRAARARVDHAGDEPAADALLRSTTTRATARSASSSTSSELWIVPVANPDGYDFTFEPGPAAVAQEPARQQRRRHDRRPATASTSTATAPTSGATTTRAPRPTRRARPTAARRRTPSPRRKALDAFVKRVGFEFFVNYHSAARAAALRHGLAGGDAVAGRHHRRGAGRRRRAPGRPGL